MGPLILLENFSDLFRSSLWLHLVNQLSSVTHVTSSLAKSKARYSVCKFHWFGRVEHSQTPCWAFSVTARQVLGRRENSYADTLLALLIREDGSTSEHWEGLCAVVLVSHVYLGATASDLGSCR